MVPSGAIVIRKIRITILIRNFIFDTTRTFESVVPLPVLRASGGSQLPFFPLGMFERLTSLQASVLQFLPFSLLSRIELGVN